MIVFDGIVYSLQQRGGISTYFNELLYRYGNMTQDWRLVGALPWAANIIPVHSINVINTPARIAERYRDVAIPKGTSLLHSSYYRLPTDQRSCKVVTTVHDFTYERFVSGPRRWIHCAQKARAIRRSDAIICVSKHTASDLLEFMPDIPSEKINVIYNGVSEAFFEISNEVPVEPWALFIGRRDNYKFFDLARQSVAAIPGLGLRVVGGGEFTESERRLLERDMPGRYFHCGAVDDLELNTLYNQSFCLLHPSAYEGFGIPVIEAMRSGCPVVALEASCIPEIVGRAALLVSEPRADLFKTQMLSLKDLSVRRKIRQAGFRQAKLYSWQRCFEETVAVYERLLGRNIFPFSKQEF
jgi:mannosyltransferase